MNTLENEQSFIKRFWIYQRERFPFFKNGALIASFSMSAICISALLRKSTTVPTLFVLGIGFVCTFIFFLQLRIFDEMKDREVDKQYRPERPVPRGLVQLHELMIVGALLALVQLFLTMMIATNLIWFLILVWGYMALMTVEFFVPEWIRKMPVAYLLSHMMIMPIIDLFATAMDWLKISNTPPEGLWIFLILSFINGIIIEIGRKTWAPEQERYGVDSYSGDWGLKNALGVFVATLILSYLFSLILAYRIDFFMPVLFITSIMVIIGIIFSYQFYRNPKAILAKQLENFSGIWVLSIYLLLGLIPTGYQLWLK